MYTNKPGIFDHPPLKGNPPADLAISESGSGKNNSNWIYISVIIVLGCVAGFFIYKYYESVNEDKETSFS